MFKGIQQATVKIIRLRRKTNSELTDSQKSKKKQLKTKSTVYQYYYKRQHTLSAMQNAGSTNEVKPRVQKYGKRRCLS